MIHGHVQFPMLLFLSCLWYFSINMKNNSTLLRASCTLICANCSRWDGCELLGLFHRYQPLLLAEVGENPSTSTLLLKKSSFSKKKRKKFNTSLLRHLMERATWITSCCYRVFLFLVYSEQVTTSLLHSLPFFLLFSVKSNKHFF